MGWCNFICQILERLLFLAPLSSRRYRLLLLGYFLDLSYLYRGLWSIYTSAFNLIEIKIIYRKLGVNLLNYASLYQRESSNSMFKRIIEKLRFGSCKTKIPDDVNAFKESEKKQEDSTKWNTIVGNVTSNGMEIPTLFPKCSFMKKPIWKTAKSFQLTWLYNDHINWFENMWKLWQYIFKKIII